MKPTIDLNNLELIPASEVPSRSSGWVKPLLDKVPEGQAVVLPEDLSQYATIQAALRRWKNQGKYANYAIHKKGTQMYVVHLSIGDK
jgi:hypothetical protein